PRRVLARETEKHRYRQRPAGHLSLKNPNGSFRILRSPGKRFGEAHSVQRVSPRILGLVAYRPKQFTPRVSLGTGEAQCNRVDLASFYVYSQSWQAAAAT
ncbi:MAG: hypothetical protein AAFQ82_10955, partial [Myxococcota bacterium]